jgi:lipoprotein-anchoring transpeptidase ErfK/SrfK
LFFSTSMRTIRTHGGGSGITGAGAGRAIGGGEGGGGGSPPKHATTPQHSAPIATRDRHPFASRSLSIRSGLPMPTLVPTRIRRLTVSLLALALAALGVAKRTSDASLELSPMLGRVQNTLIEKKEETLLDVAYEWRLGYEAVTRLNPDIDPWIPLPGSVVRLPTHYILPHAEHEGIVINIPEMRLYDFTRKGAPEVFALAIGDMADQSLIGEYRVGEKRKNPVWNVPKSIRVEEPHLPAAVPPGPNNPLGSRWMRVGSTSYGIHGTDVRWSIGRQATHG